MHLADGKDGGLPVREDLFIADGALIPGAAELEQRQGLAGAAGPVALCLSGGGYRAALFHLGGLRRLNELGLLSQVDTISAVSGGSIIAAHLAERLRPWPAPGEVVADWETRVAAPFRAFASRNIRTGPLLRRFLPWNWPRSSISVHALERRYEAELTAMRLRDLPDRPRMIFCATDMAYGTLWTSEKSGVGNEVAGYVRPAPDWSVARAVAASSCFPPIFGPLPIDLAPDQLKDGSAEPGPRRDRVIAGLRLTDGGVLDNLGLLPVLRDHRVFLVSNAGATFDYTPDSGLVWRLSRYRTIVTEQALQARKQWLLLNFQVGRMLGAYWGIDSAVSGYGDPGKPGYSDRLVEDVISEVRTDLDAFSPAEIAVLETHGYRLAEAAVGRHLLGEDGEAPGLSVRREASLAVPHPGLQREDRVRHHLKDSHKMKLPLGRRAPRARVASPGRS
jgi:NTE family protein